jgi:excisionase family DNA binding protein
LLNRQPSTEKTQMVYLSLGCSLFSKGAAVPKMLSPKPIERKFASIPDVCEQLSISRSTLYQLIDDGALRRVKVGARALIPQVDVDAFVARLLDGDVVA